MPGSHLNRAVLTACLAVLASSCHKAPASQATLHCFQTEGRRDQGLNPLLGAFVSCFEDAAACEARATPEAAACTATLPRWHCYAMASAKPGNDPLDGLTFCYPSLALCNAARAPGVALSDDPPVWTPCKPADTVYCAASDPLQCADREAPCNQAEDATAAARPGGAPRARCVARHSVR